MYSAFVVVVVAASAVVAAAVHSNDVFCSRSLDSFHSTSLESTIASLSSPEINFKSLLCATLVALFAESSLRSA